MTTSLAAVFIPILFMSGILGRLFREFAVTITAAILVSGVVSITLTPMLCSRFLRVVHTKNGLAGLLDRAFDTLFDGYRWSLGVVLRHRVVMLGVFVVVLARPSTCTASSRRGSSPIRTTTDEHQHPGGAGHVVLRDGHGGADAWREIVRQNPYIDSFMVRTGGGGSG